MGRVMGARSWRRKAVALIGVLAVLAVLAGLVWVVQEIATSKDPGVVADVYAAYVAAVGLVVSLLAFLIPWWANSRRAAGMSGSVVQVRAAAEQLAQTMLDTWRQEAGERRISTPAPVRVRWQWGPAEVTPPLATVITAPVPGTGPPSLPDPNSQGPSPERPGMLLEAGVLTQLHDQVYCRLPHGRLVLLGGAGAGKTGAMILLLLAALEHRRRLPETQREQVPVPVWLSLGGWDPTSQGLHQWATATMNRDHRYLRALDYGPDAAGKLLRTGRVALFLDGLDEMAPAVQATALARIEQEAAGLRLVLSSRPAEYRQAISEERLHHTAVIEVQPVDPDTASDYLRHDQIGAQHDRWTQVGDYLIDHPDSIATRTLNNPLTLSLARATYQDQDPTSLTDPTMFSSVTALREHLIERVLIVAYPDERHRAHATRWLAWIAHHMGTNRDLPWWHIPTWIPRWQLRLAVGIAVGLAIGLAIGLPVGLPVGLIDGIGDGIGTGLTFGLMFGLVGGLVGGIAVGIAVGLVGGIASGIAIGIVGGIAVEIAVGLMFGLLGWTDTTLFGSIFGLLGGFVFGLASEVGKEPRTIFLRWLHPRELLRLLGVGLMGGLVGGLVGGLLNELGDEWISVSTVGLVGMLVVGLAALIKYWTLPLPSATTATPVSTYRTDRRTSTVQGLGVGLGIGLAFGLAFVLMVGVKIELVSVFGLAFGLAFGVGLTSGSMPKVALTELVLATTGAGRVKFMRMLEDAHRRQVLRQTGAVYQFRHAELQDHLAQTHHQSTQPPKST